MQPGRCHRQPQEQVSLCTPRYRSLGCYSGKLAICRALDGHIQDLRPYDYLLRDSEGNTLKSLVTQLSVYVHSYMAFTHYMFLEFNKRGV